MPSTSLKVAKETSFRSRRRRSIFTNRSERSMAAMLNGVCPHLAPQHGCHMPGLRLLRKDYAARHGPCLRKGLHRAMDATKRIEDATLELDAELETWDWARAAGVSLEELRLALVALVPQPELREAA